MCRHWRINNLVYFAKLPMVVSLVLNMREIAAQQSGGESLLAG
jgi:hypothetical protein